LSEATETCLPTTSWFLYSEDDDPLGRIFRKGVPEAGVQLEGGPGYPAGQIVSFTELRATCAMRRFKVVLRLAP